MKNPLPLIRRIFALLFFTGMTGLLLIPWSKPGLLSAPLTFLQFTPSLMNLLTLAPGILSMGFFIVIITSLLTGRTYCSFLCPLGITQDIFIRIGFRLFKRKFKPARPSILLKTIVTVLFFSALFFNVMTVVSLLDPFSIFSRTMTDLAFPVVSKTIGLFTDPLQKAGFTWLIVPSSPLLTRLSAIITGVWILLVFILSVVQGRVYCNTLCPVGGVLSLSGHLSLFKIRLNPEKCTSCGLCSDVCKAGCIDPEKRKINSSECIVCFNCLEQCAFSALQFQKALPPQKAISDDRRQFIKTTGLLIGFAVFWSLGKNLQASDSGLSAAEKNPGRIPDSRPPVIPPGAINLDHYLRSCIACQACVNVCPPRVLIPAPVKAFGILHLLTPLLDYSKAYCIYECNKCTQVCPTSAINRLTHSQKKKISIGNVRLYNPDCIVYKNNTNCGACAEICPTRAVFMAPVNKRINGPVIDESLCVGCGACENVCPTSPKAIYVMAFREHQKVADIKKTSPQKKPLAVPSEEGFPF